MWLLCAAAWADDWEVGSGGDFTDLQDALNAVGPGDRLLIRDQAWVGSFVVRADVSIEPYPGESVKLVAGAQHGEGVVATDGLFGVRHAVLTLVDLTLSGQGRFPIARVGHPGDLVLNGVSVIDGHSEQDGGAIYVDSSGTLSVLDSTFSSSTSDGAGGAIGSAVDAGLVTVDASRFDGNSAATGGAIDCRAQACFVSDSVFQGNQAWGDGGAVSFAGFDDRLTGGWFCANVAIGRGGAVFATGSGGIGQLSTSVFWSNRADDGGALYTQVQTEGQDDDFLANAGGYGAAAITADGVDVRLENAIVAEHAEGAAVVDGSGLELDPVLDFENFSPWGAPDTGRVHGDPRFVLGPVTGSFPASCDAAGLHLTPGSAAIGAGRGSGGDDLGVFQCVDEIPGNGIDDDCDGYEACYADADGDGFGAGPEVAGPVGCAGLTALAGDCDDADPASYPGAVEIPGDRVDEDCDGTELCFLDADADGYGAGGLVGGAIDCSGMSTVGTDCADLDPDVHPDALDCAPDGLDQDCTGVPDDEPWVRDHVDRDGDGFGDPHRAVTTCGPRIEAVHDATDCDDGESTVHPGAEEICNRVDDDCDGVADPPPCPQQVDSLGGGGCSTAPGAGWVGAILGALARSRGRRRTS